MDETIDGIEPSKVERDEGIEGIDEGTDRVEAEGRRASEAVT